MAFETGQNFPYFEWTLAMYNINLAFNFCVLHFKVDTLNNMTIFSYDD